MRLSNPAVRLGLAAIGGPAGIWAIAWLIDAVVGGSGFPATWSLLGLWALGVAYWAALAGRSLARGVAIFIAALALELAVVIVAIYAILALFCGDCLS